MMQRETAKRLHDALAAAAAIQRIEASGTPEGYGERWVAQLAIERMIITLGEALNHAIQTGDTIEGNLPDARQIIGMRNRLVHGYDTVRAEIVWEVAEKHIPSLIDQLRSLLATAPDPDP